ncbi:hypothetical protein [Bradyrhizobium sp. AUGA SZCCT0160]|uniref:hypothetical protein n=1 Tax=Bradyrhizobium sp. AUGA SZCCT0160 TaxID=2807662 RepID=UPI001BA6C40A|nr:hypothetical protein [Bradyrhizobium sp. AUGA SZCCT0160]MBR1193256.1 hypothetical protein [Bradyrhizobium sp. AUGA SZCCT0160]
MEAHKLALTLLVLLAIGGSAWVVEMLVDRYRPDMGLINRFGFMLALALAIGFAAVKAAGAHEPNYPHRDCAKSCHILPKPYEEAFGHSVSLWY